MSVQPFLLDGWVPVLDGHPTVSAIYLRHYSSGRSRHRRRAAFILGPGQKLVLLYHDAMALFAWRKTKFRQDKQTGVECSVFRNEGARLSSELILEAEPWAWRRWPGERLFTFVDEHATAARRSKNSEPGECFRRAGWVECGRSQERNLLILEKWP